MAACLMSDYVYIICGWRENDRLPVKNINRSDIKKGRAIFDTPFPLLRKPNLYLISFKKPKQNPVGELFVLFDNTAQQQPYPLWQPSGHWLNLVFLYCMYLFHWWGDALRIRSSNLGIDNDTPL